MLFIQRPPVPYMDSNHTGEKYKFPASGPAKISDFKQANDLSYA